MFRSQLSEEKFVNAFDRLADALAKIAGQQEPTVLQNNLDDVIQLVKVDFQFINAIKMFREITGASLRDAKDVCEFLRDRSR